MSPTLPFDDPLPAPAGPAQGGSSTKTASTAPSVGRHEAFDAGESIGRYRLLQKLGEGGCGIVFLAEQEEPVRRRVALKVIKLGMDTKAVIARFEAERQALAMMEHPNIAKVFDAGATAAGRPYFVMEMVRGVRINEYCDQHNASTRERLELFMQVCQAIQHAHQKGIIHRDIKPSNVLVTVQDGVAVPKVIDFGIAKSMHGRLTEATVFTGFEQFIGTPAYMSPEQAEVSGLDIDTRSDIYSLGVVLYELLTGRLPFDPKTLAEAGLDEIRRVIREVEPARPSTRLRALPAADLTTAARQRAAAPAQLSTQLRGDLDWIVMKALEKQRNRRYESAAAFAADVMHHLHDEPVTARPPSALYRTRKFVARHRVAAGAAAAVACALLAGAVVSTWQAVRARQAERVAQGERAEARRSQEHTEDLLAFMLGDLREKLTTVGRLDVLEAVGDKAMAYFAALNARDLTDTTLARHAQALRQIGEIRMAQGRYPEALTAFSTAFDRASLLATRHPRDTGMLFERGQAEFWIGAVHRKQGAFAPAKEWLTHYRDTSVGLVALAPAKQEWQTEVASGLHNLAVLKKDNRDLAGAQADFAAKLALLRSMVAAKPDDLKLRFRVTDTESWLGSLAEQQGDLRTALAHFAAEGRGLEELQQADPKDMTWRFERADGLLLQARLLGITGRRAEARQCLGEGRKLLDSLTAHDPDNRQWATISHNMRLREAALARAEGSLVEAERLLDSARAGFEGTLAKAPKDLGARSELGAARRLEAELRLATGRPPVPAVIRQALDLGEMGVRAQPNSDAAISQFAQSLVVAAQIAAQQGEKEAGLAHAQRALELLATRVELSNDWRLLDPAARALAILGRSQQRVLLQSRLEKMGYVPLVPWPVSGNSD